MSQDWQRPPSPWTLIPFTQLSRALLCSTSFHPAAGAVQCHPSIYGAIRVMLLMLLPSPQAALPRSICTTLTDWSFHCLPSPLDISTSEDCTSALSSNNSEFLGKQKCNTSGWKRRFLNRKLIGLTEIDGIAFCQYMCFYLQGRSPRTVLWERPTATNREQLKLNTQCHFGSAFQTSKYWVGQLKKGTWIQSLSPA